MKRLARWILKGDPENPQLIQQVKKFFCLYWKDHKNFYDKLYSLEEKLNKKHDEFMEVYHERQKMLIEEEKILGKLTTEKKTKYKVSLPEEETGMLFWGGRIDPKDKPPTTWQRFMKGARKHENLAEQASSITEGSVVLVKEDGDDYKRIPKPATGLEVPQKPGKQMKVLSRQSHTMQPQSQNQRKKGGQ